jgi:hypothetical protein
VSDNRTAIVVMGGFVAALASACGDAAPRTRFVADTLETGRVVATNTGRGSWTDTERWTARVGVSIGRTGGEGPDLFGRIEAIAVDPTGTIYVIDGLSQEVRVFDPDGAHRRTLGGRGGGPGEFGDAWTVSPRPNGEVWVWSYLPRRLTVFSDDGAVQRTIPTERLYWTGIVADDGRLLETIRSFRRGSATSPAASSWCSPR